MAVNIPQMVNSTIQMFLVKNYEGVLLHRDDPNARPAIYHYIQSLDDSDEYAALVKLAKGVFIERYGDYNPV